ncbi:hypothetical protein PLEI_3855 [Photobacterium leiognathi lrivu.4.1]|uniref:Uncharacterized protein n=1 Tax=Photobacterium leiognathi lrivu.4.1 TaxID=1248232 RepID=V5F3Z7_PHOLE|nr:hypothetical protein PLEI_3855 [Photobacterium leiognathi lrivu.4.1]
MSQEGRGFTAKLLKKKILFLRFASTKQSAKFSPNTHPQMSV